MKRTIFICMLVVALMGSAFTAKAQYYQVNESEDVQLHTGFQVSDRINDRWGLNWGEEFYFGNNISQFQKLYSRLMIHYYLLPNLTLSPMVMHIVDRVNDKHTMIYDMNVIYTHRIDRLALTLRGGTRLQDVVYPEVTNMGVVKVNPEFMLRGHIGASYRLLEGLEPFANIETFLILNPATDEILDSTIYTVGHYLPRVRSNVGVKYHFDSHHSLSLYWRYDHTLSKYLSYEIADAPFGIITNRNTNNFVGLFYDFKF